MKIRILDESFYQGKETTVCTLSCEITVEESSLWQNMPSELYDNIKKHFEQQLNFNHYISYYGNHTFSVKASTKCTAGDKFDELKGKRIAEAKAFKKAYKIGLQLSNIMLNYIDRERANWDFAFDKYDDLIYQEDCNINSLTD